MWSPNELLKIEKQRDILSYITLQFFHFKKVPLEHCPFHQPFLYKYDCFVILYRISVLPLKFSSGFPFFFFSFLTNSLHKKSETSMIALTVQVYHILSKNDSLVKGIFLTIIKV